MTNNTKIINRTAFHAYYVRFYSSTDTRESDRGTSVQVKTKCFVRGECREFFLIG